MVWKKFMLYFAGNLQRRAIDVGNYILTKSENKMEHINKIELRGNVGTVRLNEYNGSKVANFTVITDFLYKTREGTAANESMWHNVVAWGGKGMPDFDLIVKYTASLDEERNEFALSNDDFERERLADLIRVSRWFRVRERQGATPLPFMV